MLGTFDVGLFPSTFLADATHSDSRITCAPSDLSCDTLYASLAAPTATAAAAALACRTPIAFHDSNIVPVYLCRRERDLSDWYKINNGDVPCSWSYCLFGVSALAELKGRGGGFEVSRVGSSF